MKKMKVLVVCNANLNRSPTVAKFLNENIKHIEAKDAGIYYGYPNIVNQKLLNWADFVYAMDLEQYKYIHDKFPKHPRVWVLGISDNYNPHDPNLIELLEWYFNTRCKK